MSLPTCPSCVYATHKCGKTGVTIRRSTGCTFYESKPQTNADKIRAMTDEELAKFLTKKMYARIAGDWKSWLKWLRQEAKE